MTHWGQPKAKGDVANPPTCRPIPTVSPASKRWAPPRRQGCRTQSTHLWATSDCVPHSKVLGTPQAAGVLYPIRPFLGHARLCPPPIRNGDVANPPSLRATSNRVPGFEALGTPGGRRHVPIPPICGPHGGGALGPDLLRRLTPPPPPPSHSLLCFGWKVPEHGRRTPPKEILLGLLESEIMGFHPLCLYPKSSVFLGEPNGA